MLDIGTDEIIEAYHGDDELCEIWVGDDLIWEKPGISQVIALGGLDITFNPRPLIDSELTVATAYLARFRLIEDQAGIKIEMYTANNQESAGPSDFGQLTGPDMVSAWETFDAAIILRAGNLSVTIPGPDTSGVTLTDRTEPYNWSFRRFSSGSTFHPVYQRISTFLTAWNRLDVTTKAATTLTLQIPATIPVATTRPGTVRNLRATALPGGFSLRWNEPLTGDAAETYRIQYRSGSGAWSVETTPFLSLILSGLSPDTAYEYRVRAENAAGNSVWVTGTVTTLAAGVTAPGPVRSLTAAAPAYSPSTRMTLDWDAPSTGGIVTSYEIEWGRTTDYSDGSATATTTDYTVTGLRASCTYNFRVRAVGPGGRSAWQSASRATTALQRPGPVRNVRIPLVFPGALSVEWDAPTTGGNVVEYRILVREGDISLPPYTEGELIRNSPDDFQRTIASAPGRQMMPDTTYSVWVAGGNQAGTGQFVKVLGRTASRP